MKRSARIQAKAEDSILYFSLWWLSVLTVVAATIYAVNVLH